MPERLQEEEDMLDIYMEKVKKKLMTEASSINDV